MAHEVEKVRGNRKVDAGTNGMLIAVVVSLRIDVIPLRHLSTIKRQMNLVIPRVSGGHRIASVERIPELFTAIVINRNRMAGLNH